MTALIQVIESGYSLIYNMICCKCSLSEICSKFLPKMLSGPYIYASHVLLCLYHALNIMHKINFVTALLEYFNTVTVLLECI